MKRFVFFVFVSFSINAYSQFFDEAKYFIKFTDKNNSPYSISSPVEFLSQRAIDRRERYNIPIDETDLPVNQHYIDSVLQTGGMLLHRSKWFNAITISTADTSIVSNILDLHFVESVENTYPLFGSKKKPLDSISGTKNYETFLPFQENFFTANNSSETSMFDIKTLNYGYAYNQNTMIGIDYLHALGYIGEGMIIAVLDAGFYKVDELGVFDSLRADNRILGTKDYVMPNGNVYEEHTHGMAVLSIMAGNTPGMLIGTAPKASYWLLRSEDGATEYRIEEDNWVAAAEFADSLGADVFNTSLGYTVFNDTAQNYTYQDMDGNTARITIGSNIAASKGILVVSSAGNSGASPWKYISAPADGRKVLAVGAVDENKIYADFSSQGPSYDERVKPNVVAQGAETAVINSENNVSFSSGTSLSGPIIAGAIACLWQANPTFTNIEIMNAIEKSASLFPDSDSLYGYGIPNFAAANIILNRELKSTDEYPLILIYPVPFDSQVFIVFHSSKDQNIDIEIIDNLGKRIAIISNYFVIKGFNNISLTEIESVRKGVYHLRIITGEKSYSRKILKI